MLKEINIRGNLVTLPATFNVFDTETGTDTNDPELLKDKDYCITHPVIMDLGMVVVDEYGRPDPKFRPFNALVKEVWIDNPGWTETDFMRRNNKLNYYRKLMRSGEILVLPWRQILSHLEEVMRRTDITAAYNSQFDLRAIKYTDRLFGGSTKENPWTPPTGTLELDLYSTACRTVLTTAAFRKWMDKQIKSILDGREIEELTEPEKAKLEQYLTPSSNYRTNAETAYRYLFGKPDFNESHTALSDAFAEAAILAKILNSKTAKGGDFSSRGGGCWQVPQAGNRWKAEEE